MTFKQAKKGCLKKWAEAKRLKTQEEIKNWWCWVGSMQCDFCIYFKGNCTKCALTLIQPFSCCKTWDDIQTLVRHIEFYSDFPQKFHKLACQMYSEIAESEE